MLLILLSFILVSTALSFSFHKINAFHALKQQTQTSTRLHMGWGDILKNAMANDPSLPPMKDPGLSNAPQMITVDFVKDGVSKKVKTIQGTSIRECASRAGVEIRYQCKKGECKTCEINVGGKVVRACQSFLPKTSTVQIIVPSKK